MKDGGQIKKGSNESSEERSRASIYKTDWIKQDRKALLETTLTVCWDSLKIIRTKNGIKSLSELFLTRAHYFSLNRLRFDYIYLCARGYWAEHSKLS